jgi:hypothetical protein
MCRLLLAYFCFYHLGVAAYISELEGNTFWEVMEIAARNKLCDPDEIDPDLPEGKWPRGAERRHFRGDKCVEAVKQIREFSKDKPGSGAEHVISLWTELGHVVTLEGFMKSVQVLPLFGPWISFKAADVLERVMSVPIDFPNDLTLFYKEPRAALDMLNISAEEANRQLLAHYSKIAAPPRWKARNCNIQEVETVCCKWKSMINGHYWVGKDIHELRRALKGWGKTADKLLRATPKEVEMGLFK